MCGGEGVPGSFFLLLLLGVLATEEEKTPAAIKSPEFSLA